jgi:endoglucanase
MEEAAKQFLHRLLVTPGISGFEQPVQNVVADYARGFCDSMRTDPHGNLIMYRHQAASEALAAASQTTQASNTSSRSPENLNQAGPHSPRTDVPKIMLAGHADQIGLLVSYIDDKGFLYFQTVGGWDPQQLVGTRVQVWSKSGPIPGVIARKPIHLMEEADRKVVANPKTMWIDIGASNRDEAANLIQIGDSVTLHLGAVELRNGLITAPALDNRSGLWVVIEAMRRVRAERLRCQVAVASTVQEEIGLRGAQTAAYSIAPDIGIAVDVTHATDCPDIDLKQNGDIGLGKGPVIVKGPNMSPSVSDRLEQTAKQHQLPYQRSALGRAASNDSNVLQISRGGVATGVVAIPNRYMHSGVEVCSYHDLNVAADLIARFIEET